MAVSKQELEQVHAEVVPFPIVQCGCGCGLINTKEHAYILSKATGEYYADMVCMTYALGVDIDMMDRRACARFLERWEGVEIG